MGEEGPVRDADARRSAGQGHDRTRPRRHEAHHPPEGASRHVGTAGRREGPEGDRGLLLDAAARLPRSARARALARRAFHGQARQRDLDDQPRDRAGARSAVAASRSTRCAFAPTSISTAPDRGRSSTGSAATSGSAARPSRSTARTGAAARPTSIRRPASAISTSHRRFASPSATRISASISPSAKAALSRRATGLRCRERRKRRWKWPRRF